MKNCPLIPKFQFEQGHQFLDAVEAMVQTTRQSIPLVGFTIDDSVSRWLAPAFDVFSEFLEFHMRYSDLEANLHLADHLSVHYSLVGMFDPITVTHSSQLQFQKLVNAEIVVRPPTLSIKTRNDEQLLNRLWWRLNRLWATRFVLSCAILPVRHPCNFPATFPLVRR
jgi:hypothetical protein